MPSQHGDALGVARANLYPVARCSPCAPRVEVRLHLRNVPKPQVAPMSMFSKEKPKRVVLRTQAELICSVCDFDLFFERKGQLNTAVASFFGMDWTNPTAE